MTSVAKMITFENGVQWYPPPSTPHSSTSSHQDSRRDPFFCSVMHTPADPAVAAPGPCVTAVTTPSRPLCHCSDNSFVSTAVTTDKTKATTFFVSQAPDRSGTVLHRTGQWQSLSGTHAYESVRQGGDQRSISQDSPRFPQIPQDSPFGPLRGPCERDIRLIMNIISIHE